MTYLLDTNIIVFLVRGLKERPNPTAVQRERLKQANRILQRAEKHQRSGHGLAVSAITVGELEFGARASERYEMELQSVRRVLTPFELVPFDAEGCAQHYGALRHQLEAAGKPIGSLDTLIAAHAMALGATLVTSDASDFARVPGLRWEDWSS